MNELRNASSATFSKKPGTVYWITGFAGAGKTVLGTRLFKYLQEQGVGVVYLDGDIIREVLGHSFGNSLQERKKLAYCYARMCKMLSLQGISVVCATISMFHEVRHWNRDQIERYREIYIKVPMSVLIKRDQKQLYSRALKGEITNVMGVDVEAEEPVSPDLVLENDGQTNLDELTAKLIASLESDL